MEPLITVISWGFFDIQKFHHKKNTLPETNGLHLKMDGWNTMVSYWDGLFSGAMLVSGRVYPNFTSKVFLSKNLSDCLLL